MAKKIKFGMSFGGAAAPEGAATEAEVNVVLEGLRGQKFAKFSEKETAVATLGGKVQWDARNLQRFQVSERAFAPLARKGDVAGTLRLELTRTDAGSLAVIGESLDRVRSAAVTLLRAKREGSTTVDAVGHGELISLGSQAVEWVTGDRTPGREETILRPVGEASGLSGEPAAQRALTAPWAVLLVVDGEPRTACSIAHVVGNATAGTWHPITRSRLMAVSDAQREWLAAAPERAAAKAKAEEEAKAKAKAEAEAKAIAALNSRQATALAGFSRLREAKARELWQGSTGQREAAAFVSAWEKVLPGLIVRNAEVLALVSADEQAIVALAEQRGGLDAALVAVEALVVEMVTAGWDPEGTPQATTLAFARAAGCAEAVGVGVALMEDGGLPRAIPMPATQEEFTAAKASVEHLFTWDAEAFWEAEEAKSAPAEAEAKPAPKRVRKDKAASEEAAAEAKPKRTRSRKAEAEAKATAEAEA